MTGLSSTQLHITVCDNFAINTGNEIILYTIAIDICHHKFVHRIYNIKSEPSCKQGHLENYDVSAVGSDMTEPPELNGSVGLQSVPFERGC